MPRARLKHPIGVHSLSFRKSSWTRKAAEAWLVEHGFDTIFSSGSTTNFWRFQLADKPPGGCAYRNKHWGRQIMATYCIPAGRKPKIVSLRSLGRKMTRAA